MCRERRLVLQGMLPGSGVHGCLVGSAPTVRHQEGTGCHDFSFGGFGWLTSSGPNL